MLHPTDYVNMIFGSELNADQVVMARVALNVLFDPDQYPVDLSEVMALSGANRILVRGFLAWCAFDPTRYQSRSEELCERLRIAVIDPGAAEGWQ